MVMDESYVMNQCKEDVCFVSTQFQKDMVHSRYQFSQYVCQYMCQYMCQLVSVYVSVYVSVSISICVS